MMTIINIFSCYYYYCYSRHQYFNWRMSIATNHRGAQLSSLLSQKKKRAML